jgi:periplasmic divalent cation tolerance protein
VSHKRRESENRPLDDILSREISGTGSSRHFAAENSMRHKIIVLVTCGSRKEARKIARSVVVAGLAACVSVVTAPVESIYRWKGKVKGAQEFLLIIKTTGKRFAALEAEVRRLHSYEVPEIIALPIERGSKAYLAWIDESTRRATRL